MSKFWLPKINKKKEKTEKQLLHEFLVEPENDEKFAQYLAKKYNKPVWFMRIEWFLMQI